MTQARRAHAIRGKVASRKRATDRTLARRRADFTAQMQEATQWMALAELTEVKRRMKALRDEYERLVGKGNSTQYRVADEIGVPHRTFQSWENGEVETDRESYGRVAAFYTKKLARQITANWILFGSDVEPESVDVTQARVDRLEGVEDRLAGVEQKIDRVIRRLGLNDDYELLNEASEIDELEHELGDDKEPGHTDQQSA